ncbi:MAG TPA: AraC family transcriptional regulator [Victivallales bacterium]|nr:AraC family transcriptional regulator [Victivallales bacterium]
MNNFKQHGYPVSPDFGIKADWDVFISYIGFFYSSGDFRWEQKSPMYCVHAVQKGKGVFKRGRQKFIVGPGEAFTFFPGDNLVYYDSKESPWEYIWFRPSGKNVERALALHGITRKHPHSKILNPGKLKSYLHEIASFYANGTNPGLFPVTAAFNCLEMICGRGMSGNARSGGKSISESFISVLESQMDNSPSINSIAESMKVDRTTLFRSFVREHGISPKKYIDNLRIDKAASLLTNTNLGVKEISEACGFSHSSHFGKVFLEHLGMSPSEWRKKRNR